MPIRRLYFDTQVFSYLSEDAHIGITGELQTSVEQGRIEVLGSLELLGEFVPLADRAPEKHKRITHLFWTLCGRCVLRPWNELIRHEIRKRNRLSYREAYLGIDIINSARALSRDASLFEEWSDGVRKRKGEYVTSMATAASEFEKLAMEKWGARETRKFASELRIDRGRIQDWGRDLLIRPDPSRHGLGDDQTTWPDISVLPCANAYVAMTLAWRRKCHEAKRQDKGSDFYDSMHYALGSFAGEFVTDDRVLRHAISLIEWRPPKILSAEELSTVVAEP